MQMSKMLRSAMTASQPAKTTVHNTEGETGGQRERLKRGEWKELGIEKE